MSETAKQIAVVVSFLVCLAVGIFLGYLVYNDKMSLAMQYGWGGNIFIAAGITLLITVVGSIVMYKGMHPY